MPPSQPRDRLALHAGSMADNDDVPGSRDRDAEAVGSGAGEASEPTAEQPLPDQPPAPAEPASGPAAGPVLKTRWRDRAWSFRAMLAVALATLVIGGVAGGSIVALADGDGHDHHGVRPWGPGGPMGGPGWKWRDPRGFDGDGGPRWRWDDGPQQDPRLQPPTPSPSAGSTG